MGIQGLLYNTWIHPHIYYSGFAKMLRENGLPVNGKYYGRNMNADLLGTMKTYHDKWYNTMDTKVRVFALGLHRVVQTLLQETFSTIEHSFAHLALKRRATEELTIVQNRIETIYGTLVTSLHVSLGETHLKFTTEIDIYCPIAMEMKICYGRTQDRSLVGEKHGMYIRQRMVLQQSIIDPPVQVSRPLLEKIEDKMMSQQREVWKSKFEDYITHVLEQMDDFSSVTEQLLMNPSYATAEHKQARGESRESLTKFDISLKDIKERFEEAKTEHDEKKIRREET